MKVNCMYYSKRYTEKPINFEPVKIQGWTTKATGEVHNTLLNQTEIELKELADGLSHGATFRPALLKDKGNKKEDWLTQQLFAMDFDNDIVFKHNVTGKPIKEDMSIKPQDQEKRDNCHIYIDVRTTVESEIERCKDYNLFPAFGYYSFSSILKRPRFRLVFVSDVIITDLEKRNKIINIFTKQLFINSDPNVKNEDRIFYGGNGLIKFDINNRFNADELLNKYHAPDKIQKKQSNDFHKHKKEIVHIDISDNNNIKAIKDLNVRLMKATLLGCGEVIKVTDNTITSLSVTPLTSGVREEQVLEPIVVQPLLELHSQDELYKYIHKLDLSEYLGVSNNEELFICVLPNHLDTNASAHIWKANSGTPIYKCFGCSHSYTIIGITERLAQCSTAQAIEFIKAVYDIVLYESDWTKKWKSELIRYATQLDGEELRIQHPDLYSLIRNRKNHMKSILLHFSTLVNEDMQYQGKPFFYSSYHTLLEVCAIKPNRREVLSESLTLFTLLNMINKMQLSDIPKKELEKAKEIAKKYGHKKLTGFYSFDEYGVMEFEDSNEIAKELKLHHYSIRGLSREYILRAFGEEKANEAYPQFHYENKRGTSDKSDKATLILVKQIESNIDANGYCMESILKQGTITFTDDNGKLVKINAENQWKKSIQEILDGYTLQKIHLNNEYKDKYNIGCNGYPFIIIKAE